MPQQEIFDDKAQIKIFNYFKIIDCIKTFILFERAEIFRTNLALAMLVARLAFRTFTSSCKSVREKTFA